MSDYTLRFRHYGFHQRERILRGADLAGNSAYGLDVQLEPISATVLVKGRIESERGEPLPRQRINLDSPGLNTHYRAVSGAEGAFAFPGVVPGEDYLLSVAANRRYGRFSRGAVTISPDSPPLEIRLPLVGEGWVSGQLFDAQGVPLAGFPLLLRSGESSRPSRAVTGGNGRFGPVALAPGRVTLFTRSSPAVRAEGLELRQGEQREVWLKIDRGRHEASGSVKDGRGMPLAGARVSLVLSGWQDDLRVSSSRSSMTGRNGRFRFAGVGPGLHHVEATAEGYATRAAEYDVGAGVHGQIDIVLERTP